MNEPFNNAQEPIEPFTPKKCSPDCQSALVDLWLSGESNEAKLILRAFQIGVEEGNRQATKILTTQYAQEIKFTWPEQGFLTS